MCDRDHQYRSVRKDDRDRIPRRGRSRSICAWSRLENWNCRPAKSDLRSSRTPISAPVCSRRTLANTFKSSSHRHVQTVNMTRFENIRRILGIHARFVARRVLAASNSRAIRQGPDAHASTSPSKADAALNQNDRALRAIWARVRACSAVRADTISCALPANMSRLRSAAPETDPTKGLGKTYPTFRFVHAYATPNVSDPLDCLRRPSRFRVRSCLVQMPHGPGE